MVVAEERLSACLERVEEILEHYKLVHIQGNDVRRYADCLADTCSQYLGKKLRLLVIELSAVGSPVKGMLVVTGDGYDVCVARELNYCWQRFVWCKELFQLILDHESVRNMDLNGHVEACTVAFPSVDESNVASPSVESEFLAEIAAMEFLFPYKRRLEELDGPLAGQYLAIAEKYKAPQVYVEKYLSQTYMENLRDYYDN
jgi:hypothetical protein